MGKHYLGWIYASQNLIDFYNSFWKFFHYLTLCTYDFDLNNNTSQSFSQSYSDTHWHYEISIVQGPVRFVTAWWNSFGLLKYVAEFGGISIFIITLISLIVSGYQRFIKDTAMLASLYAEEYEFSNSEDEN